MTYDTKLPRFAKKVPDNGDPCPELPFCVSPSAWVQIIRALTPRTEDFDRTVVDLLTSPFVGYRAGVNASVVQEVVGRMDHFADASPEMAIAVLTDTARVGEIEKAVETEDDAIVEDAVRVAYSGTAREMQEAVSASQQRLVEVEDAIENAEARAAEAERLRSEDLGEAKRLHQQDQEDWEVERQKLEERASAIETARDRAEGMAEDTNRRIQALEQHVEDGAKVRDRNRRIAAGSAIGFVGLAVALVGALVVFSNVWAIGAVVVAGLVLVLVGARIALGQELGGEIVTWGGLIAAIAAVVVSIVLSAKSG